MAKCMFCYQHKEMKSYLVLPGLIDFGGFVGTHGEQSYPDGFRPPFQTQKLLLLEQLDKRSKSYNMLIKYMH